MPELLSNIWTVIYGAACVAVAIGAGIVLYRDSQDRKARQDDEAARVRELVALEAVRTKAHRHYVEEQEKSRKAFGLLPTIGVEVVDDGDWYDAKLAKQARANAESSPLDDLIVR